MIRIAGIVAAVLISVWTGLTFAQVTAGSATRTEHHVLPAPRQLTVNTDAGNVTIERARGSRLVVDSRVSGTLKTPHVQVDARDGVLHLGGGCGFWNGRCGASFVIQVPAGTFVRVNMDSGDLKANGLTAGADLRTDSGDVLVTGVSGPLSLSNDSGDIDAEGARATATTARADSGDIALDFAVAPRSVAATTDSGDVRITVPRTPAGYRVQHATDSGDDSVTVRTDPAGDRSIRARTDSGDLSIRYP